MRVLLLSDVQERGGAGIAAGRLARALLVAGHEVIWLAGRLDQPPRFDSQSYAATSGLSRLALKVTQQFDAARGDALRAQQLAQRAEQIIEELNPDVVNVHNLHGMRLPPDLPARIARKRPVVWTLHDMWAFTGTCAYSMGCRAFESRCNDACPLHMVYPTLDADRVPRAFDQRRQALERAARIAFVTPSDWLRRESQFGMLRDQRVVTIANSVDLDTYHPRPRAEVRRELRVSDNAPVLLATAPAGDVRKGRETLTRALGLIDEPTTLMTFDASIAADLPTHVAVHVLDPTRDERRLALAYAAADVHVLPTLADNLPNTLLEAAACGTPSVASDVGGVSEAIEPGVTGWLCTPGDPVALADTIRLALRERSDATAQRCRDFAEAHFAPQTQAAAYEQLFTDLAAQNAAAA